MEYRLRSLNMNEPPKQEATTGLTRQVGAVECDPEQSAIVLIEFQRQWTDPGLYNLLIRHTLNRRNVVDRARETVRAARDAGVTVVHAPLVIDPDEKKGWLATLTHGRVFTKDTSKAEFTPGLYEAADPVATGRYTFDAFVGSDLADILDTNDVQTVFFAGFTTDQCVATAVETASEYGYDAYLVADLTATWCSLVQRRYERKFADQCVTSDVIPTADNPSEPAT